MTTGEPMMPAERFLSPCELPDALERLGVGGFDEQSCRRLVASIRASGAGGVIRKNQVRASAAVNWMLAHPEWTPYGDGGQAPGLFASVV